MATRSTVVNVTTSAGAVVSATDTDGLTTRDAMIKNTGATTCYIGGSDVTSVNGYPLAAGDGIAMSDINPSDLPYARTASGTTTLNVLETRV